MANKEKHKPITRVIFQVAAGIFVVLLIVIISLRLVESETIRTIVSSFGYIGVFFISVMSGFSVAVPIPTIAFLPLFINSGFSFWPLLFVMTVGMTTGDAVGYLLGSVGRKLVEIRKTSMRNGRIYRFLEAFQNRHRTWPLVILVIYISLVPAPNEILVIPMAFMGYKLRYVFPIMLVGNFIFNTLVALSISGLIQLL